jgi:hypothetical protein
MLLRRLLWQQAEAFVQVIFDQLDGAPPDYAMRRGRVAKLMYYLVGY